VSFRAFFKIPTRTSICKVFFHISLDKFPVKVCLLLHIYTDLSPGFSFFPRQLSVLISVYLGFDGVSERKCCRHFYTGSFGLDPNIKYTLTFKWVKPRQSRLEIQVLWDVTPFRLVKSHQRFEEEYCFILWVKQSEKSCHVPWHLKV
jgi:hypothetical protein